ncbi:MAG: hypothetical protein RJR34_12760 [Candidatus Methanoculleus thermohydrogenotrophicum]|nr:hypothetical protein [Candidatus Methanoculleus thermohydrogenotrophicum]
MSKEGKGKIDTTLRSAADSSRSSKATRSRRTLLATTASHSGTGKRLQ